VKALLQSTMSDELLPDLYITSFHREKINKDKQGFI